jgi:hypothetical protein
LVEEVRRPVAARFRRIRQMIRRDLAPGLHTEHSYIRAAAALISFFGSEIDHGTSPMTFISTSL